MIAQQILRTGSVLLIIAFLAFITYLFLPPKLPISPLGNNQPSTIDNQNQKYVILGFAPYWNLKKMTPDSLKTITHLAFFALYLQDDGSLYTHINRREEEPGYTNYKRIVANPPVPANELLITFMQKDQASLQKMLSTPKYQANAISVILDTLEKTNAAGLNIDFEPLGDTPPSLRDNFTLFITELSRQLKSTSHNLLTISIYPSAASRPRLWDLPKLSPMTDYFVVMSYDYTLPSSQSAGPNSPLRDSTGTFEHSVVGNLSELVKQVDSRQLLLGIPLYGYEWETTNSAKYAPAEGRGVTASLERIESMLKDQSLELIWDRNSLTPYGISTESGQTTQIYFENAASVRLKLELVKSSGLGGVAFWALGYDNNVPWLWPLINELR